MASLAVREGVRSSPTTSSTGTEAELILLAFISSSKHVHSSISELVLHSLLC